MKTKVEIIPAKAYEEILRDIRAILVRRKREFITLLRRTNNSLVMMNWEVGKRILRDELQGKARAGYGERLIPKIAEALNIGKRELDWMVRFARCYHNQEDIKQEIPWSHYRILSTCSDEVRRKFYENMIISQGWSRRELELKIHAGYYEKHGKDIALPSPAPLIPVSRRPQDYFQDIYSFPFLKDLKADYTERDVETLINRNFRQFLNELGPGFYMGLNQKNLFRKDGEVYRPDWEAYSRPLRCICVIDVKRGPLRDRDIAEMIRYLLHYDRYDRMEGENPAIGFILCEEGARKLKNYLVEPFNQRIFVSQYLKRTPFGKKKGYAVYRLRDCDASGDTIMKVDEL